MVTPALFARYPTPADLAAADPCDGRGDHPLDRLLPEQDEEPASAWRRPSSSASTARCRPRSRTSSRCPGVGRKTANVVRSVAFDLPGLPVDTHVGRLSRRLGLTEQEDPVKVELELNGYLPAGRAGRFSLRMILHGRRVCVAQIAAVRRVRAGGHLPVEPAADEATPRDRDRAAQRRHRRDVPIGERGVLSSSPSTRFPPPGLPRQPGSAAWRRQNDGLFERPSFTFSAAFARTIATVASSTHPIARAADARHGSRADSSAARRARLPARRTPLGASARSASSIAVDEVVALRGDAAGRVPARRR